MIKLLWHKWTGDENKCMTNLLTVAYTDCFSDCLQLDAMQNVVQIYIAKLRVSEQEATGELKKCRVLFSYCIWQKEKIRKSKLGKFIIFAATASLSGRGYLLQQPPPWERGLKWHPANRSVSEKIAILIYLWSTCLIKCEELLCAVFIFYFTNTLIFKIVAVMRHTARHWMGPNPMYIEQFHESNMTEQITNPWTRQLLLPLRFGWPVVESNQLKSYDWRNNMQQTTYKIKYIH